MSKRSFLQYLLAWVLSLVLVGCTALTPSHSAAEPPSPIGVGESASRPARMSEEQAAALLSLSQVDDYPLYTMHYEGAYAREAPAISSSARESWGCSLFAALGDPAQRLYGRNFDWEFSPALLLFTNPPDGYASVSMVDMTYLDFSDVQARQLISLTLEQRRPLLEAPEIPFDGMNEQGLAIGMAAVPQAKITPDPLRPDIYSVEVMRQVLDHAGDVEQATAILQRYDILWGSGPPLHYLVADRSGRAALVEFYQGKVVVYDRPPGSAAISGVDSTTTWHAATNFSLVEAGASTQGQCWRYDHIVQTLAASNGKLDAAQAMALLEKVSQQGLTQWSLVYDLSRGQVDVAMGRDYKQVHSFRLPLLDPSK